MESFLLVWLIASYSLYVFIAERFTLFPPKQFSQERHGKQARRIRLGYWMLASMIISGVLVGFVMTEQSLITKSLYAAILGIFLGIPALTVYVTKLVKPPA